MRIMDTPRLDQSPIYLSGSKSPQSASLKVFLLEACSIFLVGCNTPPIPIPPELVQPGGAAVVGVVFIAIGLDAIMLVPILEEGAAPNTDVVGACGARLML
jgi:hypothetical protein